METALARTRHLLRRHLPFLLALASFLPRLLSFVTLKELYLSLSFRRAGLSPTTVALDAATSIHIWAPARRAKPALVLIHGFGGNAKWQWHLQVGPLSRRFDLYVPDLVFFGKSASSAPDRSVEFQAQCVAETMRRLGVRKYSVCGISYGGFVAYLIAAAEAEEVEKVVIMTSAVCTTTEQREEIVRGLENEGRDVYELFVPQRAEDLMALLRRSVYRSPKWVPDFILQDFIDVMYKENRKERVELLQHLLSKGAGPDAVPALKQETLIIWGNRDNVFPLYLAHHLKRHLGEKAKLEIVENAGHALQMDNYDAVNELIRSFLLDSECSTSR